MRSELNNTSNVQHTNCRRCTLLRWQPNSAATTRAFLALKASFKIWAHTENSQPRFGTPSPVLPNRGQASDRRQPSSANRHPRSNAARDTVHTLPLPPSLPAPPTPPPRNTYRTVRIGHQIICNPYGKILAGRKGLTTNLSRRDTPLLLQANLAVLEPEPSGNPSPAFGPAGLPPPAPRAPTPTPKPALSDDGGDDDGGGVGEGGGGAAGMK